MYAHLCLTWAKDAEPATMQAEHRLVYRIVDDTVQIVQCRYHYE